MVPVNKVHHVHTLARAAEMFGEDEDWLFDIACEMDAEDGLIRIYGPGDEGESTLAFTDFGLETLGDLIKIYKADPGALMRWNSTE
jgi:hypothetical protein